MATNIDDSLFLGLDLSTQGLKAVLIDEEGAPVHESAVNFDRDLPSYGTTNGAIRGPGPGEVTSPKRHKIRILRGRGVGGRRWDTLLATKNSGGQGGGGLQIRG
ncbi:uncharacterized protein TRAVEDRAFT_17260 [Trametes versicolor FP-101664 SS1]|uniref:uncharacterized protein n=1 Tax=Trametes versicolor (strain FP-101664) TaxID=717944 RepID=UPI0004622043|nr:uncharacterized protein TRAVEDRAFT_17260 [Trametes versicolor FP-101664 SS1]EIW62643.1 hypothetical protein TRAVEDRAFT_17260 [Trametes versicolor FP-101664 SS1]